MILQGESKSQVIEDDNRFTQMLGQRYETKRENEVTTFGMNLIQSYTRTRDKIL